MSEDTAALVETVREAIPRGVGSVWDSGRALIALNTLAQRLADLTEKAVAYAIESNERLARAERAEAVLREIATSEKLKPSYVTDPYVRLAVDNARAALAATPTEEPGYCEACGGPCRDESTEEPEHG